VKSVEFPSLLPEKNYSVEDKSVEGKRSQFSKRNEASTPLRLQGEKLGSPKGKGKRKSGERKKLLWVLGRKVRKPSKIRRRRKNERPSPLRPKGGVPKKERKKGESGLQRGNEG